MKAASTSRSSCTGPTASRHAGELRDQFHHVNDIVPTIYETLGIEAPSVYRGLEQLPVSGVSMRYSFDAPDDPSRKQVQYYEMMGHRAIYADGWKAVTRHQPGVPFEDDDWELYHLAADRSECHNLAAAMPDKVAELVALWWAEAEEQGVLPLDDRTIELFSTRYRDRSAHPTNRQLLLLPAHVTAARTGGPGARRAGLGHGGRHRAAGRGRRGALRHRAPRTRD